MLNVLTKDKSQVQIILNFNCQNYQMVLTVIMSSPTTQNHESVSDQDGGK